jgi:uncharacterized protein (DUF488 family)
MFYRRKVILAILDAFGGELHKISLQKLLFLFSEAQNKKVYDFVPYQYGCFSFSLGADLSTMIKKNILVESKKIKKLDKQNYINKLTETDKNILFKLQKNHQDVSSDELMKFVYKNFPYYAINSIKAKEILNSDDYASILKAKPQNTETVLYTIGYEGVSLEFYLNKLLKNNIKLLIDVRKNPLSMKFGFSKNQLKTYCNNLSIEYIHIPEVGIESEYRRELNSQNDYDNLFDIYKEKNLTQTAQYQQDILNLLIDKKRIALTCFEANICQCHRKHLAEAITSLPDWKFTLKHI